MNNLGNSFDKGNRVFKTIFYLFLMLPLFAAAQSRTKSTKLMEKARDAFIKRNYQEAIVTAKKNPGLRCGEYRCSPAAGGRVP